MQVLFRVWGLLRRSDEHLWCLLCTVFATQTGWFLGQERFLLGVLRQPCWWHQDLRGACCGCPPVDNPSFGGSTSGELERWPPGPQSLCDPASQRAEERAALAPTF